MRFLVILAAFPLFGAASPPVQPAAPIPVENPYRDKAGCPETPMSLARKQGARPKARRLNELPPALTFMAVDRRVYGCAVPMLMSELRH